MGTQFRVRPGPQNFMLFPIADGFLFGNREIPLIIGYVLLLHIPLGNNTRVIVYIQY